ncbi:MAG: hypothetical protein HWD92_07995 [Flavobacteriia bacterium]|nr:hypothetical protein [Flavobacteriia bacterium]
MKARLIILLLVLGIPIALYIFLKPPSYVWYYSENMYSDQPYGLQLYMNLIEDRIDTTIDTKSGPHDRWNLDSIGDQKGVIYQSGISFRDSIEFFKLDSLARAGHHVVFNAGHLNKKLLYFLKGEPYPDPDSVTVMYLLENQVDSGSYQSWNYDNIGEIETQPIYSPRLDITFNSTGATSRFRYARENDTIEWPQTTPFGLKLSSWTLDSELDNWEPLAYLNGKESDVVAFRVPKGEGYVYVITTFAPFTNYCLSSPENFAFASDFTALYPDDFFWLSNYYFIPEGQDDEYERESNSPLQFLVSNRSLRWAWYILLISLLLFLVFRTQRQQRIIPVITAKKNQSLEFAKSLGILQSKTVDNHANTALEIKRQFRLWTRSRFPRITEIDDAYRDMLIQMLPQNEENIKHLFFLFERAEKRPELFESDNLNSVYTITRYIYDHV